MTHVSASAIMPSSEMHFFDVSQSHIRQGTNHLSVNEGINANYPDPSIFYTVDPRTGETTTVDGSEFFEESGILKTFPPDIESVEKSGVFHYNKLQGAFSNAPASRDDSITDFTIFNHYIHHHGQVSIPYLSTYTATIMYNPYIF